MNRLIPLGHDFQQTLSIASAASGPSRWFRFMIQQTRPMRCRQRILGKVGIHHGPRRKPNSTAK